jgi:phage repressor protein C with HTH and peptisase S24 domain
MVDTPSDVLRRARLAKGYPSAAEAARAFGWNAVTYASHENGHRGITVPAAQKYARAFGVSVAELLQVGLTGHAVVNAHETSMIFGEAAVGVWRDKNVDSLKREKKLFTLPGQSGQHTMRYAVLVADESVDRVIRRGEYAIIADLVSLSDAMPAGALVYVERERNGLIERTIRRIVGKEKERVRLAFDSSNSSLKGEITAPSNDRTETVTIVGRVVAVYREFAE